MSTSTILDLNVDWQTEMKRIATKHHIIVCWVAIILNPIWFIGDYFTIPSHWKIFFVIRIVETVLILIALLFRKKISTELLMMVPFLGISLQNAYMWSVMTVPQLQQHAFAYIALFIGAGMLVLWKPIWSISVIVITFIANIFFLKTFSPLTTQEILINGGMLVGTVAIISIVLIHSRYSLTKKEIIARLALAASNKELEQKNDIIEEKNKDITDSINYAKRIQEAILPAKELKQRLFPDSFVLFQPRDIVSGDFYWFTEKDPGDGTGPKKFIAAVDCTGHGVPGAFMSMIGNAFLNQIVNEKGITQPAEVLNQLRELIIAALKQTGASGENQDGMDISLLCFNADGRTAEYAGANNPLWIIKKGDGKTPVIKEENGTTAISISHLPTLTEIKADKQPIGIYQGIAKPFTNHLIQLEKDMELYISTDGFADQMGGSTGKKLRQKSFKDLVISMHGIPMKEQELIIKKTLREWKGLFDQTDDILVIGIKI